MRCWTAPPDSRLPLSDWVSASEADEGNRVRHFMAVAPSSAQIDGSTTEAGSTEDAAALDSTQVAGDRAADQGIRLRFGRISGPPSVQSELPDVAGHVVQTKWIRGITAYGSRVVDATGGVVGVLSRRRVVSPRELLITSSASRVFPLSFSRQSPARPQAESLRRMPRDIRDRVISLR